MNGGQKASFSLLLAGVLFLWALFPFAAPGGAVFARGAAVLPAPAVTAAEPETRETDTVFRFSLSAPDALRYENYRRETYETVSAVYSDAQIADSDVSWILYPVVLLCEATPAGGEACPVKAFGPDAADAAVSLYQDVLPGLAAGGGYSADAFGFTLSFSAAADINGVYVKLSDETMAGGGQSPATVRIDYVLPAGADNAGNPSFLPAPLTLPLTLAFPTLRGNVFAGWQTEAGVYVDTVPAGTKAIRLYGRFTPRVYKIVYVLTTRPGYAFVRVRNSHNPTTFTYGEETPLQTVDAPSGYSFGGWFRNADFSGKEVTAIGADEVGDVVLYARWLTQAEAEKDAREKELREEGYGDLNRDGDITAADARLALRAAVGLETLSPGLIARAAFETPGRLTAADARILLRVAVGLDLLSDVLDAKGNDGF